MKKSLGINEIVMIPNRKFFKIIRTLKIMNLQDFDNEYFGYTKVTIEQSKVEVVYG